MSISKSASLGAASLLAAAVFAGPALAGGLPDEGRIAARDRACSTSGNVGLTTDYVFRGISQTFEDPALQGGVDFTCGRFYFGFWGSNIDFDAPDTNLELDLYAGIKGTAGRISWDLGVLYYAYPGQGGFQTNVDYFEIKAAASAEVWKGGTVSGTVFYSPDYTFELGPVTTLEGSIAQALPSLGIFSPTVSVLVGHSFFSDDFKGFDLDYTYWNAGVTLGFLEKWSLDVRYWDTDGEGFADVGDLSDERVVATLKYSF